MEFQNYCSNCPKNVHCCKFYSGGFVFIGLEDAKRIKERTKLQYKQFLEFKKLPNNLIAQIKNEDPSLEGYLRYSQLKNGKLLILRQKKKICFFLKDKKCSIYDIRPKICQIYPHWAIKLTNGKLKVIEHDINTKCAIVLQEKLDKKQIEDIKKLFLEIEKENKSYKKDIKKFSRVL